MQRISRAAALLSVIVLFATACGGGGTDTEVDAAPAFVEQGAGQLAEESVETTTTQAADAGGGAAESQGNPEFDITQSDIPTDEEEDPDGEFFDAVGEFMACLNTEGTGFIGIPNGGDETEPVNQPSYREALGKCAASSEIVSKMEAADDTSRFTPEEIEEQNRQYSLFVDCLIGRGWTIPPLTPDENGSLQVPYIDLARDWIPPGGGSLLDDNGNSVTNGSGGDFADCGFQPDGAPEQ